MAFTAGDRRKVYPTAPIRPVFRMTSTIACAAVRLSASGFSHSTCLPPAMRPSTTSRCRALPTTTLTASMSRARAMASQSGSALAKP
jgi:hypothetical protein